MNRRNFIEQSCFACFTIGAGFSLLSLESCSTTQVVSVVPEKGNVKVDLNLFTNTSKSLIVRVKELEHDIFVVKTDTSYRALYMQCTHQNNPVNYNSGGIVCNVHGSRFNMEGNVMQGPASRRLRRFVVTQETNFLNIAINSNETN